METAIRQVVESAYDAATGGISWQEVGNRLKLAIGARTASLWIGDPANGEVEILYTENMPEGAGSRYARHFYALDPWVEGFGRAAARTSPGGLPNVALGWEILPLASYERSEFYQDFAREFGLYHLVGGVYPMGQAGVLPLGLHRPKGAEPFGEAERDILRRVVPHVQHAIRLKLRLAGSAPQREAAIGAAALDAFPMGAIIVDATMRVVHANRAAELLCGQAGAIRLRRAGPPPSPLLLEACGRADSLRLSLLCRAVAEQASRGGGVTLLRELAGEPPATGKLALLVTGLPSRLLPSPWAAPDQGVVPGYALVLARELANRRRASPVLLMEFFGLTRSEAEVAAALCGGVTTEAVAQARRVEPATIRSQVRIILEKTGAPNLRRLEQMLALLPDA